MAVTTETFNADGSQKIFTPASFILSESHVRIDYTYADPDGIVRDHSITSDSWDIINNSVVFREAPTSPHIVSITISTDGSGLETSPSAVTQVAGFINELLAINEELVGLKQLATEVVPHMPEVLLVDDKAAEVTTKAQEVSDNTTLVSQKSQEVSDNTDIVVEKTDIVTQAVEANIITKDEITLKVAEFTTKYLGVSNGAPDGTHTVGALYFDNTIGTMMIFKSSGIWVEAVPSDVILSLEDLNSANLRNSISAIEQGIDIGLVKSRQDIERREYSNRVGELIKSSGSKPFGDCLVADGSLLYRDEFPELWEFAQASGNIVEDTEIDRFTVAYTYGDGATTFRIPDWRGLFDRAFDAGKGVDVARKYGSRQDDAFKRHYHGRGGDWRPIFAAGGNRWGYYMSGDPNNYINNKPDKHSGGSETRPKNGTALYCIKYK